jgi:hypothetical protein
MSIIGNAKDIKGTLKKNNIVVDSIIPACSVLIAPV